MSRISAMTIGLVLIFIGAQLFLVKSYLLTPAATQFVQENFNSNNTSQFSTPGSGGSALFTSGTNGSNRGGFASSAATSNPSATSNYPGQSWPYYQTNNAANGGGGVFQNSGYSTSQVASAGSSINLAGRQRFVPPRWIMWPALFLGAVFFLHGAALRS